jgi:hypothetical protein
MQLITLREAQEHLPELVKQAEKESIGLTDEDGDLVGLLTGISDDDFDDLLVQTPAFQAMMARSRASLQSGAPIPASVLLAEARARLAEERDQKRSKAKKDVKSKP